ncbi:MAG: hypothetical protein KA140_04320 [Caldisericia bacterium]|nr:hypothetical protein [Caldisericia bacterium]
MRRTLAFLALALAFSGINPTWAASGADNSFFKVLAPSQSDGDCTLRLSFQIGKTYYWKNGQIKGVSPDTTPPMGTAPEIKKGKTFLIIRYITSEVGATLQYWKKGTGEDKTKQDQVRIVTKQGKIIDLWIGNPMAKINGVSVAIDPTDSTGQIAPYIKGKGYTMLPLRFVGDNLGAKINWISSSTTAELIFTDEECIKKCCEFSVEPTEQISLCPGEEKSVNLAVKNICQGKSITLSFTPGSGISAIDNKQLTIEANGTAILKATVAMPTVISEKAVFTLKVSSDCGVDKEVQIEALFREQQCLNECQWICGCIGKLTQSQDVVIVEFFEGCAKKNQRNYIDTGSTKDLMLGLTFGQYVDKYGSNPCAQICVDEDGDIQAWRAFPDRTPCCQDHVFAKLDLVDCNLKIATGVDPEGTRWVFDLSEFEGCDAFVAGKCYDFAGTTVRPRGISFSGSGLLEVTSVQEKDCQGAVLTGKVSIIQCKSNPPMAMLDTGDGSSVEVELLCQSMRNADGRIVDCQEVRDGDCLTFVGYHSGERFVACKGDILPCMATFETFDCRLDSVVLQNNALLSVKAFIGCKGEQTTFTSPRMLGDDLSEYRNLLSYSVTGNYARLTVNDSTIVRWKPLLTGCGTCVEEQLFEIIEAKITEKSDQMIVIARNLDGRLVTFEAAKVDEAMLTYKGTAKLSIDGNGKISGWEKLSGGCCFAEQGRLVPSKKSLAVSSISTEIVTGDQLKVSNELGDIELQQLKLKLSTQVNPWDSFQQYGANWIGSDLSSSGDTIEFLQSFCVPECTAARLKILNTSTTQIFLDEGKTPMATAEGIAHLSDIFFTVPAGSHKLRFVQKKSAFSGLMFVLTGQPSKECKTSSYQISFGTDRTLEGACAGQKKKYALLLSNTGEETKTFSITPVSVGLVINPSTVKIPAGEQELVQVTVLMPENPENSASVTFSFYLQVDGTQQSMIDFSIPYGQCDDCSLKTDNTLIILPEMCPDDSSKIEINLKNSCSRELTLKSVSEDKMLELPATEMILKADDALSFNVIFKMPARGDSKFLFASFSLKSEDKTVVYYDVVAMFKNDEQCCCDFGVELVTRFVAEQTMEPGETFTYDYLVKNKCSGRKLSFTISKGDNIVSVSPESFIVDAGKSVPMQVKALMPEKKGEYAPFSFAVACDCGKKANISFTVKYKQQAVCCDYEVGFTQDIPQPLMLEPDTQYVFGMGVKNKCKEVTISATVIGGDYVQQVEPGKLIVGPGQIAGFRLFVKMPSCKQGEIVTFRFRVIVDGCDEKTYEIPAACGTQMANCCDYDISDVDGQLKNLKICPGESKTIKLTLVNKCQDRLLTGSIKNGDGISVDPPNFTIQAGKSIYIYITVTMPQNATIGSAYTFAFLVMIPGCTNRKYSFEVICTSCGNEPEGCCDFTLNLISNPPSCVTPGKSFEMTFELCNLCSKSMQFSVSGTGVNTGVLAVGANTCTRFNVLFYVPQNVSNVYTIKMSVLMTSPTECVGKGKQIELPLKVCN